MLIGVLICHYLVHSFDIATQSATAKSIFEKIDGVFEVTFYAGSCDGMSFDNTSVNICRENKLHYDTGQAQKNPALFFMGCPCHIMHNTCMKAAESFAKLGLAI